MRLYLLLFILLIFNFSGFGQGIIKGSLTDDAGLPLPFANVGLEERSEGTSSDENGAFLLEAIPAGSYTLMITSVGFQPLKKSITLNSGQTLRLQLKMKGEATQLQQVEIVGRKEESYKDDYSFAATKTGTMLKDVPQSVSTITKELIIDQQITKLGEAVKNISGVSQFTVYNDLTIRGFRSRQSHLVNGLRTAFSFWTQPNINLYEKVEVVKGPASAMFANTRPGGTINFVTKKPLQVAGVTAQASGGSFNTWQANVDATGPVGQSEKFLYRVNAGYSNTAGFRDLQGQESFYVAPSFSFLPTNSTRINLDLVYQGDRMKIDRGQAVYDGSNDFSVTPITLSTSRENDYLDLDNYYMTLSVNQKITKNINFNASYLKFRMDGDLAEHRTNRKYLTPSELELRYVNRQEYELADNLSAYFVANAQTGPLQHTLLWGVDYSTKTYDKNEWVAIGMNDGVANFDLDQPDNSAADVSQYDRSIEIEKGAGAYNRNYTTGVYLQDQIKWNKLQLLLGLRQEFYAEERLDQGDEEAIRQTAFLPRVGLVYSAHANVNIYGTYTEGFEPQDYRFNTPQYGGPFDPLKSKMVELGAKGAFFEDRLSAAIGIYQIDVENILINDPNDPEKKEQRGGERSQGVELDVAGQITPSLSLSINYAFNNAYITDSDNEEEIGRQKENAPVHQAGFWGKYTLKDGPLKGLGFGLGSHYVGDRVTNVEGLVFDDYLLFDAALFYEVGKFNFAAHAKNLMNETYYIGGYSYDRLFPGMPRNFSLSLSIKL
ncbi:TonB-dependent receptor [Persicobacter diffluens]|uniref:Ligand-gated channel n=1 Tax=Persicobacter diffluens TaxID=981 RepID=A0AAN5AN55_9BACT|nr:ligand-gated channel [Persicobacter diffluens]